MWLILRGLTVHWWQHSYFNYYYIYYKCTWLFSILEHILNNDNTKLGNSLFHNQSQMLITAIFAWEKSKFWTTNQIHHLISVHHNFVSKYMRFQKWMYKHQFIHQGLFNGISNHTCCFNTLRPRQNGRRFADDTFKRIFVNENVGISINISLKFVPEGLINNIPALVQIMAWRRSGDKPLSEPMMVNLLTHICVTRPQWVKWDVITHPCPDFNHWSSDMDV